MFLIRYTAPLSVRPLHSSIRKQARCGREMKVWYRTVGASSSSKMPRNPDGSGREAYRRM